MQKIILSTSETIEILVQNVRQDDYKWFPSGLQLYWASIFVS